MYLLASGFKILQVSTVGVKIFAYVADMLGNSRSGNKAIVLNDDNESMSCEGLFTEEKCLEAIKTWNPTKTPGTDGLLLVFTKRFGKTCLLF